MSAKVKQNCPVVVKLTKLPGTVKPQLTRSRQKEPASLRHATLTNIVDVLAVGSSIRPIPTRPEAEVIYEVSVDVSSVTRLASGETHSKT